VLSGARVPDYSLVIGVPGRVMALTEQQKQRLQDPTASYVRNARRYIDAGLGMQIPRSWPGA
jgi:carbonic anhydrase/acetyltransferase-like protein (isoleucine patch superfamily)